MLNPLLKLSYSNHLILCSIAATEAVSIISLIIARYRVEVQNEPILLLRRLSKGVNGSLLRSRGKRCKPLLLFYFNASELPLAVILAI